MVPSVLQRESTEVRWNGGEGDGSKLQGSEGYKKKNFFFVVVFLQKAKRGVLQQPLQNL
jgi:hypothetical protein